MELHEDLYNEIQDLNYMKSNPISIINKCDALIGKCNKLLKVCYRVKGINGEGAERALMQFKMKINAKLNEVETKETLGK